VFISSLGALRTKPEIIWDEMNLEVTGGPESTLERYRKTKLANSLTARKLAILLKDYGITTYHLHPGTVGSNIWRSLPTLAEKFGGVKNMMSEEEGAKSGIYCSIAPNIESNSGLYYDQLMQLQDFPAIENVELVELCWRKCLELTGLTVDNFIPNL